MHINPSKLIGLMSSESTQVVCIYLALAAFAKLSDEESATINIEDLVKYSGVSKSSVIRQLKYMHRKGIVSIIHGKGKMSNRYHLELSLA